MRWITALQLEAWGRTLGARADLPKLVSDLIRASAADIASIRFPSGDKGQVRGFDGHLESETSALNIPLGASYWEFGTSGGYQAKALGDLEKRTHETSPAVRAVTSFVFVSPWTWDSSDPKNKLEDFIAARNAEGNWKEVHYIDGVCLEHWLEQNPAVAAWHARNTLKVYPLSGVRSIDEFWAEFSARFVPPLTEEVILCSRDKAATQLVADLSEATSIQRLVADTPDEALAFAIAAIRKAPPAIRLFLEARTLVIDIAEAGCQLPIGRGLVLLLRGEAARAPAQFHAAATTFVPLSRQHRGTNAPALERPASYELGKALQTMGLEENRALSLARGCGRSLGALARLIPGGSYEPPTWEADARALLPGILAGAWDAGNDLDRQVLEVLSAGTTATDIQRRARQHMLALEPPFDMEGSVWKVRAPMDAFLRVGPVIDDDDLRRLRQAAIAVFSRVDPSPDPDAVIGFGTRQVERHSDWLRDGLATTILLLAIWSDVAEVSLGGSNGKAFADDLVRSIPGLGSNPRLLTSLRNELPLLAEAAPDPLLEALELLLEGTGSAILPVFDEKPGFLHADSDHHGVVWALETLAWDPAHFRRAIRVLAKLASLDPGGNIGPRPASSLHEIFTLWDPGTNASTQERVAALDEVVRNHPGIGWQLLFSLLPNQHDSSSPTAKPRLREAGAADRRPITYRQLWESQAIVCQRAIALASSNASRWEALIPRLFLFPEAERALAIQTLTTAMDDLPSTDRNVVWQSLKKEVRLIEHYGSGQRAMPPNHLREIQELVERHSPTDPVRAAASELDAVQFDINGNTGPTVVRSGNILGRLFAKEGAGGIVRLAELTQSPWLLGMAMDHAGLKPEDVRAILEESFSINPDAPFAHSMSGVYRRAAGADCAWAWLNAKRTAGALNDLALAAFLQAWPDERHTWWLARQAGSKTYTAFWANHGARNPHLSNRAFIEAALHLLRNQQARQALGALALHPNIYPVRLITRLLDGLIEELNQPGAMPDSMTGYYVEKALDALEARDGNNPSQVAAFELRLYPLLEHGSRRLRLFDAIAQDPELFHKLLREVYMADGESPPEAGMVDPSVQARARRSWSILNRFDRLPGDSLDGVESAVLQSWTARVLQLGLETKRLAITQSYLGRVLAHAPADGSDGVWPDRSVRDLIEQLASTTVETGLQVECYNMRGVHTRGLYEGGVQERDLAKTAYEGAAAVAAEWPRTASMLRRIGDSWSADGDRADTDAAQRRLRD